MIFTTQLRIAAGVCVLSSGLILAASTGAIATADETSGGGAATGTGTQNTATDSTAGANTAAPQATGTASPGASTAPDDRPGPTSTVTAQTNTSSAADDDEAAGLAAAKDSAAKESAAKDSATAAPTAESTAPASASQTAAPTTNNSTPVANTTAPTASTAPPATTPAAVAPPSPPPPTTFSTVVVAPMGEAFASVARALGTSAATFAGLPTSETPITDVITSMQAMLNSVAGAGVTLYQVGGDLYTLLGVSQPMTPALIGTSGALTVPPPVADGTAPLFGPVPTQLPQVVPVTPDAPLFGSVVQPTTVGGVAAVGLKHDLSLSGLAPVASAGGAGSFFDHVISAVLVPASLTAIAAIALPGIGALLIVSGAGVRFGYRQAKAAYLMRVSGIARFAGSGPMGVVRSGSLIALHSRGSSSGRSKPAHAASRGKSAPAARQRHLERVA